LLITKAVVNITIYQEVMSYPKHKNKKKIIAFYLCNLRA
jgi:hypothetical protein